MKFRWTVELADVTPPVRGSGSTAAQAFADLQVNLVDTIARIKRFQSAQEKTLDALENARVKLRETRP